MMTLSVEFSNTLVPLSEEVESNVSLGKDVLRPKRLSDAHFQILVFFKENQ